MNSGSPETRKLHRVRLWDPFLRLFHWALVICVCAAWYLGEFGPGIMTLHFYFGYAILALLAFRVVWGLFGAWPARFRDFLYGPGPFFGYLGGLAQRKPSHWPGHNPIGALSVFLLLGALVVQAVTGLYTDPEDFINAGPLVSGAPSGWVPIATGFHQTFSFVILLLVIVHLGAIVFYRFWKKENLVPAMVHGKKLVRGDVPADRIIEAVEDEAA